MALKAKTRISKNPRSNTQMIVLPAAMTMDSQYPFKAGQQVELVVHVKKGTIEIVSLE